MAVFIRGSWCSTCLRVNEDELGTRRLCLTASVRELCDKENLVDMMVYFAANGYRTCMGIPEILVKSKALVTALVSQRRR